MYPTFLDLAPVGDLIKKVQSVCLLGGRLDLSHLALDG